MSDDEILRAIFDLAGGAANVPVMHDILEIETGLPMAVIEQAAQRLSRTGLVYPLNHVYTLTHEGALRAGRLV